MILITSFEQLALLSTWSLFNNMCISIIDLCELRHLRSHLLKQNVDDGLCALRPCCSCAVLIFLDQAIESIFNLYLSPAFNLKADIVPPTAFLPPNAQNLVLLLCGPFVSTHIRINHVNPALTTLPRLALAARTNSLVKLLCNPGPLLRLPVVRHATLRSNLLCDPFKNLSFLGGPCRLFTLDILEEKPSFMALKRGSSRHQISHSLPIRLREVLNESISLVSHVQDDVLQQHRLIFLPLGIGLRQAISSETSAQ